MRSVIVILVCIWALWGCASKDSRLITAAKAGDDTRVQRLIRAGADVDAQDKRGMTAFMAASMNGHLKTMYILKDAGAKSIVKEPEIQ